MGRGSTQINASTALLSGRRRITTGEPSWSAPTLLAGQETRLRAIESEVRAGKLDRALPILTSNPKALAREELPPALTRIVAAMAEKLVEEHDLAMKTPFFADDDPQERAALIKLATEELTGAPIRFESPRIAVEDTRELLLLLEGSGERWRQMNASLRASEAGMEDFYETALSPLHRFRGAQSRRLELLRAKVTRAMALRIEAQPRAIMSSIGFWSTHSEIAVIRTPDLSGEGVHLRDEGCQRTLCGIDFSETPTMEPALLGVWKNGPNPRCAACLERCPEGLPERVGDSPSTYPIFDSRFRADVTQMCGAELSFALSASAKPTAARLYEAEERVTDELQLEISRAMAAYAFRRAGSGPAVAKAIETALGLALAGPVSLSHKDLSACLSPAIADRDEIQSSLRTVLAELDDALLAKENPNGPG